MHSRLLAVAACAVGLLAAGYASAEPGTRNTRPAQTSTAAVATMPSPLSNFLAIFTAVPRTIVSYPGAYKPGTIIVKTAERRLYLVLGDGQAMKYGIGVGRDGFTWSGSTTITAKREWPDWTPPDEMLKRRPDLPRHMVGGPDNPLGARAMYLGDTQYRIHGSNEPHTIGTATSSGCIRMTNDDVIDLYNRTKVGATVIVQR
jgi:lipoprotein-anchoring transpeptidase ErfK/SrfK